MFLIYLKEITRLTSETPPGPCHGENVFYVLLFIFREGPKYRCTPLPTYNSDHVKHKPLSVWGSVGICYLQQLLPFFEGKKSHSCLNLCCIEQVVLPMIKCGSAVSRGVSCNNLT